MTQRRKLKFARNYLLGCNIKNPIIDAAVALLDEEILKHPPQLEVIKEEREKEWRVEHTGKTDIS